MSSITNTIIHKRGFTLVETLVYVAGLVLLLLAIFTLLTATYDWYRTTTVGTRIDEIGITLSDRLVRDIRSGQTVELAQSSFGTSTGSLFIDAVASSTYVTKKYSLISGRVAYQENSGTIQYLSPKDISVTKLYFTSIATPASAAIRFEINITYSTKTGNQTKSYSSVGIMKNSYE